MRHYIIALVMISFTVAGCAQTSVYEECTELGGEAVEEFSECEGISQDACEELGGDFNECASACRNQPDAEFCTMQCVAVCQF